MPAGGWDGFERLAELVRPTDVELGKMSDRPGMTRFAVLAR